MKRPQENKGRKQEDITNKNEKKTNQDFNYDVNKSVRSSFLAAMVILA